MTIENELVKIHQKWATRNTCKLKKTATQAVFGSGNSHAEIVFIGEAPGKNEDLQGIPFVGAAGKFLNEMLAAANLVRSDVYITNIVKYRPPNNRDPLPEEIKSCAAWLHEELATINPVLIVFLGRHSMNHFFPEAKISDVHGTLLTKKIAGFPTEHFFALYHPAAALYNGSMRDVLIADFKKVPKVIEGIKSEK
ncbi:MAG: hypothetical protein RL641_679 [Candidatus Parcubacteria bacterium]|jgi:DNA polymerase